MQWVIQGENAIVPTAPGHAGFEFGEYELLQTKPLLSMELLSMTYVCVDHVFGETSTTDQIYSTITKPIVHSVMQGFNGTYKIYTFHRFSHAVIVRCTVIKDTIGKNIYTFHRFSHAVIVRCTVIKDTIGKKTSL